MASPLRRLNADLWRYRWKMGPGLLCALLSALAALFVPGVVREAVDAVPRMVALHGAFQGTPIADQLFSDFRQTLILLGLLVIGLSLLSGMFLFLMRRLVVVASRDIEYDLRNRLYAHLQTLSGAFYNRFATGDVMTRATSDIERVRRYVGPALMYLARAAAGIVTALVVMLAISPALTFWLSSRCRCWLCWCSSSAEWFTFAQIDNRRLTRPLPAGCKKPSQASVW